MNPFWLMKMRRWVDNPPSKGRVILVLCVVAFCAALFLVETYVGWPEWLTVTKAPRVPRF